MGDAGMKLKHVNPHNVRHLIPAWAIDPFAAAKHIDELLDRFLGGRRLLHWTQNLEFWVEFIEEGDRFRTRIAVPQPGNVLDARFQGRVHVVRGNRSIEVPLNDMLKGSPSLDGTYSVYIHAIDSEVPLHYVGVTKNRWFDRLAQHESRARGGSPYIFHRALRDHAEKPIKHICFLTSLNRETAMKVEEEWVDLIGLYPKGMNMIPGGDAGIRYLHTLGALVRTPEERDEELDRIASVETLLGKPNPLCAARWAADQDFVNRVICGHGGRLSVDEVRAIRMLSVAGRTAREISGVLSRDAHRVSRVMKGTTYARVA